MRLWKLLKHDYASIHLYNAWLYIMHAEPVDIKAAIVLWQAVEDMLESREQI